MSKAENQSPESPLKHIISHAKEYGFVFPSSEIYDGLQAVYDYGPYGVELKNNLKTAWWKAMTQLHANIVGLDAAIFMHPDTWVASGHVASFNDPMIDNKDSKKRYRADTLLEDKAAAIAKSDPEAGQALLNRLARLMEANDLAGVRELILEQGIVCPISGTANWTDVRQFNLMFSTQVGAVAEDASVIYLRPETAQGIFVNFLNVHKSARTKVPFGIAQIGKAFRNEVVARQFIFRMREFEQMEMQFFVRPGTELEWYEKWRDTRYRWHLAVGLPAEKLKFHVHEKLAHYANAAVDIEFEFPFGSKEIEGIHSRTDFDLKSHQELSKKKLMYFDSEINQNYIPYVVETSVGADRLFLATLCNAYRSVPLPPDADGNVRDRVWLSLHPALAPIKVGIMPITKKDGLPEIAQELYKQLHLDFTCIYEDKDSIGKRYARQDTIGTPFCIAIDHQTKEDGTVTLRHRDEMNQERIALTDVHARLSYECSFTRILEKL